MGLSFLRIGKFQVSPLTLSFDQHHSPCRAPLIKTMGIPAWRPHLNLYDKNPISGSERWGFGFIQMLPRVLVSALLIVLCPLT
jgi:hypothetical protein